jgi:hypothetical protein
LGIGRIPHSLLGFLKDKRDLGIHTEMITDDIVDLVKAGVINGSRKSLDRGKIVASFCLGTRKLYDFIDNNPMFAFHPTEYVNDPGIIGQQNKMVAINTALEVDLTGQVCADSIGTKFFSGIGGQVDFNRGAARSPGGKAIIALPSTAHDGTVSRIVGRLSPGAGVVTTRGDVHYVVTEYGVAYLHGKSIQERTLAMISIAHPKFQAQLLRDAIDSKYVSTELAEKENKIVVGPKELKTTYVTPGGNPDHLPADSSHRRTEDAAIVLRLVAADHLLPLHEHDQADPAQADPRFRIHRSSQRSGHCRHLAGSVWRRNHRGGPLLVGSKIEPGGGGFHGHGRTGRRGESARFLFRYLIRIARRNGIRGFTAEVLSENKAMQRVFNKGNCKTQCNLTSGVYSYEMDFICGPVQPQLCGDGASLVGPDQAGPGGGGERPPENGP